MGSKRSKIDYRNEACEVVKRQRTEKTGWKMERLLAIRLLLGGELEIAEVARLLGLFFFQFLHTGGRWQEFLRECPLTYTGNRGSGAPRVMGTILLIDAVTAHAVDVGLSDCGIC